MARAQAAREAGRNAEADTAEILAEETAGELAVLRVADAARREWAEAHASEAAEAQAAEGELRRRDQAERVAQAREDGQEPHVETDEEFRARLPQIVAEAEARYAAEAGKAEPRDPGGHERARSVAAARVPGAGRGDPGALLGAR